MIRKIVLPVIFLILAFGFWISPNFKEIAAGVAIFLFGMTFLEDGFRAFTGGILEDLLERTTNSLPKSIAFGALTTTIMQSSSLVSVITISFLSAGLIALPAGIGIIYGANLGTTTGAWLIAGFGMKVKISAYAMPMLVFGLILSFQRAVNLKGLGYILAGLGFLFLGIHYMKEGFEAFREHIDLTRYALAGYPGLFLYALIGIVATVIMQSSHATLVLIITALAAHQITYENALALAIGANVGTTITAILGALSANYQGRRLAAAHLIFNLVTGVIAIIFIHAMMRAVDSISGFIGIAADDYTMKLAVFHTLFNTIGLAVMAPLTGYLVHFLERMIPAPAETIAKPKYLNESAMNFPETLLEAVRKEVLHLYDNAFEIICHGLSLHRELVRSNRDLEKELSKSREAMHIDIDARYAASIKTLESAIVDYISRATIHIDPAFAGRLFNLQLAASRIVRAVKAIKHLQKNMDRYIKSRNPHLRREYNTIRLNIARVLRMIWRLRTGAQDISVLDLDALRLAARENRNATLARLDAMIRAGDITAREATSLMNDLSYGYGAVKDLVKAARILFSTSEGEAEAASIVSLNEDEVNDLAAKENGRESARNKEKPGGAPPPGSGSGSSASSRNQPQRQKR